MMYSDLSYQSTWVRPGVTGAYQTPPPMPPPAEHVTIEATSVRFEVQGFSRIALSSQLSVDRVIKIFLFHCLFVKTKKLVSQERNK